MRRSVDTRTAHIDDVRTEARASKTVEGRERRTAGVKIAYIVDATYLKWTRTVPKSAKKLVSVLSPQMEATTIIVTNIRRMDRKISDVSACVA